MQITNMDPLDPEIQGVGLSEEDFSAFEPMVTTPDITAFLDFVLGTIIPRTTFGFVPRTTFCFPQPFSAPIIGTGCQLVVDETVEAWVKKVPTIDADSIK